MVAETPTVHEPDRDVLRRLADHPPGAGKVLSVFVDLDPTLFSTPDARTSQVTSLMNDAEARLNDLEVSHEERRELTEDIERVRRFLLDRLQTNGARALAVYASAHASLFEAVQLPDPLQPRVELDELPALGPLAPYVSRDTWCVLLCNRQNARIFMGPPGSLEEIAKVRDDVHGKHSQGGWSQARYERSVEREVQWHLDNAGEAVFRLFEQRPFDHLLVGAASELMPEVEDSLHAYVKERLRGRIDIDIEHSSLDDVRKVAQPAIDAFEREREERLLGDLREHLGQGVRAAQGHDDVLRALEERRVEILLLDGASEDVGHLTELALLGSADVVCLRHHDLQEHGSIAAILRY